MAELYRSEVPQFAAHWEAIGIELGLERHHIDNISKNHAHNPQRVSSMWGKLDDAINVAGVSDDCPHVIGNELNH